MPKLVVMQNDAKIGQYPLHSGEFTIGRRPENHLVINNRTVSGHHAKIVTVLNISYIEDLNSTNGTYINGRQIQKYSLHQGDVITIGKHQLMYITNDDIEEQEVDTQNTKHDETVVFSPEDLANAAKLDKVDMARDKMAQSLNLRSDQNDSSSNIRPRLKILNGQSLGKELLLNKPITTLGQKGIKIAEVHKRQQEFYLVSKQKNSEIQLLINGERLTGQEHRLRAGDILDVAGMRIQYLVFK